MTSFISKSTIAAILILPFIGTAHAAETYKFDPNHSTVIWKSEHMGFSSPSGRFTGVSGSVTLDETNPAASSVDVTIDLNSISTGLPKFDEHLKSKDFFNVETNKTATFKSTKVTLKEKNEADVEGNLTLNGVTKPVTLEIQLNKIGEHPFSKLKTAGFSGEAKIKRSDFGISYGIPNVGDEVELEIEVEASVEAPAK